MGQMFLLRRITWRSFSMSMRPKQRAVALIGGGMVFCDWRDERDYFR